MAASRARVEKRRLQVVQAGERTPHLQMVLSGYAVVQGLQIVQTAACNRLHDVGERLARWLLMAADRVGSNSLAITHDFLAAMLGADRSSVSVAAKILQRKKIIEYRRGALEIRVLRLPLG